MKRTLANLNHLALMQAAMDDETFHEEIVNSDSVSEPFLELVISTAGYVDETKAVLEAYREETKALQKQFSKQMDSILDDLQRGIDLQEKLNAEAQALKQAQVVMAQLARQHQTIYTGINPNSKAIQPDLESDSMVQPTQSLGM